MPTFCRHNRFIERCPICSKTLPGREPGAGAAPRKAPGRARQAAGAGGGAPQRRGARGQAVRVHREGRAEDDGYRSELVPGLRASADALRLVEELAFSSGRLLALAAEPPALYGEVRALAGADLERATWSCFLIAYLCPLEGEDQFAGIRMALAAPPGKLPDLDGVPLGPRTSHDPARGLETLIAYRQWVARGGQASLPAGSAPGEQTQAAAFTGDPAWTPARRFERVFERLTLPGFARMGRYELLVLLGRLGLYELAGDSLQLGGARGLSSEDPTTLAAKRVFGIGDPLLLERRAAALAEAAAVPLEALDLALANWQSSQRATLGFPPDTQDEGAFERAGDALGL
jgi:alpha-glutamyl/putrescinyl thymine pyrophosphorylase-like protein